MTPEQVVSIDAELLTKVGAVTLVLISAIITFVVELMKRQVNKRLDKAEEDRRDWQKEQVEDAIRASKGQQVMSDSLNVILQHMIYGNHVESLERSQQELQDFRRENNEAMLRKAAKYNLR